MVDSESDDLTGKQVHNSTDISKASGYSHISNITNPNLIRLRRIEPLLQVVDTLGLCLLCGAYSGSYSGHFGELHTFH